MTIHPRMLPNSLCVRGWIKGMDRRGIESVRSPPVGTAADLAPGDCIAVDSLLAR